MKIYNASLLKEILDFRAASSRGVYIWWHQKKADVSKNIFIYFESIHDGVYKYNVLGSSQSPPPPLGETLPCHQSKKWSKNPNMKSKLSLLVFV